ncbi:peroxiredoxin [Salmonella enterica subsp. enterica]|nr:peroxiredoxin [Salmonella enterica subsp. enterica serovar Enteritidis]
MTISVGDKLPEGKFKTRIDGNIADITTAEIFDGKTVVLFGVPGAFTPTCNNNHLPGFLDNRDAILARGVDTIAVVAANDVHVMNAWAKSTGGEGKILFLADGSAEYAKQLGLNIDLTAAGMGMRYTRFALLAKDGVVTVLNIEDSPGKAEASSAAKMLEDLGA